MIINLIGVMNPTEELMKTEVDAFFPEKDTHVSLHMACFAQGFKGFTDVLERLSLETGLDMFDSRR